MSGISLALSHQRLAKAQLRGNAKSALRRYHSALTC
jgi:hypothetical protein